MITIQSGDAQILYEILGDGPPVILLHPFPANHELWLPAAQQLASRYHVILPDLRGHGDSADAAPFLPRIGCFPGSVVSSDLEGGHRSS